MRGSIRLHRRAAVLLASAGLTLFAGAASATGVFVGQCDTCNTLAEFQTSAELAALQRGTLGQVVPGVGTFVMVNRVNPRSAIVKVWGQRVQVCDSHGECRYRLIVTDSMVVNETGGSALEADLERTDEMLHANARAKPLPPVNMSPTYSSSFVTRSTRKLGREFLRQSLRRVSIQGDAAWHRPVGVDGQGVGCARASDQSQW